MSTLDTLTPARALVEVGGATAVPAPAREPRHLLSIGDLSRADVEGLLERAAAMEGRLVRGERLAVMQGRIMATLFFQPSTRTRLSFESAMLRLGGSVIGFADAEQSRSGRRSVGERLSDAARVINAYGDVIVVRHSEIGAAREFARHVTVPVLNAGDGHGAGAEHPTQALLDLYTMAQARGRLDGITVAVVGGLHQRVCHSLLIGLSLFADVRVKLISPRHYQLTNAEFEALEQAGLQLEYVDSVDEVIPYVDVLYHSGISEDPDEPVPEGQLITAAKLRGSPRTPLVLHPLPRHAEIPAEVDELPNAGYFRQAAAGVPVRMAVLESFVA
jgi:aspartate carbamoyltransferase catalytic subunit